MPLDVWMAAGYVMDFVQSIFIFFGTILRTIAENEAVAQKAAEDVYYIFGFLKYFSDFAADHIYYITNNTTMMRYSVGVWQKVALNSPDIFGDVQATKGLAYIWNLGYQCIQPGMYCASKGPETTYYGLYFFKWLFSALAEMGGRYASVFV